jgi:hypothetical protein
VTTSIAPNLERGICIQVLRLEKKVGLLAALMVAAACASGALADGQQWPPPGVSYYGDPKAPDISGLWLGSAMGIPGKGAQTNTGQTADGHPPIYWAPWPLPYTPAFRKMAEERAAAAMKGHATGDPGVRCLPFGLPVMLTLKPFPDEIVQTPGAVVMFMYGTFPVVIWTDGRPHPKDLQPSYNGHSIGHWVGDTLFVETVGIKASTPLDGARDPHSAKIHLKWTLQRVDPNTLHLHLTVYDDDAFTEPATITNIFHRKTDRSWEVLDDGSCFENNAEFSAPPPDKGFIKF